QRARNAHGSTIIPERRIVAARRVVMEHDEIANAFPRERREPVVFRDLRFIEALCREERQELRDAGLDEVDARRFERLHEAGREPERDAVLVPELLASARRKTQQTRFSERTAVQ